MSHRERTIRRAGLRRLLSRRQSERDGFYLVIEERKRHTGADRGNAKRKKLHAPRYFSH